MLVTTIVEGIGSRNDTKVDSFSENVNVPKGRDGKCEICDI